MVALPDVPQAFLVEGFRRAAIAFLVNDQALSDELRGRMLGLASLRLLGP